MIVPELDSRTSLAATAVERGTKLLSILSHQAAAARAEAQCAELQLLLGEAREGAPQRLQHWLQTHATDQLLADPTNLHVPTASMSLAKGSAASLVRSSNDLRPQRLDDWDPLRAPARVRLFEQALRLSARQLVKQWEPTRHPTGQLPQQRQRRVSRLRGLLASFVAHGLLIVLLGWITLRLPSPPASLRLQAAPTELSPESLEVSQPTAPEDPEVASDAASAIDMPFDLSEMLTDVSVNSDLGLGRLAASTANGLPNPSLLSKVSGATELIQSNATFFGAAASGNCFCYVIDGSGSMRNGPWEAAKLELLRSLATLKEKQRFYIIFFNRELSPIPLPGEQTPAPAALYATSENLTHTRRWLDTLRIDTGAPPNDALALAIEKEPDAIYLLTDGVTKVDVPKFLRDKNRISDLIAGEQVLVPIHTIAFYSLQGQALLKQLAAENQGQFTYVPAPRHPLPLFVPP